MNVGLCAGYATSAAEGKMVDPSRPRQQDTWQCLLCWIQNLLDVWGNVHLHVVTSSERIAAPPRRRQRECTPLHVLACGVCPFTCAIESRSSWRLLHQLCDHCNCIISIATQACNLHFLLLWRHCQACSVESWFSFCLLFLAVLLEASMCARANRMCAHLSFPEYLTRD